VIYLRDANATGVVGLTSGRSLDQNDVRVASEILADLGVRKFRLLTDGPTANLRGLRTA